MTKLLDIVLGPDFLKVDTLALLQLATLRALAADGQGLESQQIGFMKGLIVVVELR